MSASKTYFENASLKVARILLMMLLPGLLLSGYRAWVEDGAFAIVATQAVLYLVLLGMAIRQLPIGYKQRLTTLATISAIVGVGGVIRNETPFIGFLYWMLAVLLVVPLLRNFARYAILLAGNGAFASLAYTTGADSAIEAVSHFLGMSGISVSAIYFLGSVLSLAESQRARQLISSSQLQGTKQDLERAVHQLEHEQKRQSVVSRSANIAFFEFDYERGTMDGDALFLSRFGRTAGPLSFAEAADQYPKQTQQLIADAIDDMKQKPIGSEIKLRYSMNVVGESEPRWMSASGVNILRDGHRILMGASIDVTDEHLAKERAETAIKNLEKEQERQAQMYAVIGHELRTPAASLQMTLDDLEEGESLDPTLVGANIEQLLAVIDTLRSVAQPQRLAQASFSTVSLDELLQAQCENMQGLAQRQGFSLASHFDLSGAQVRVQATLLRQVVANLVKNALIHSGGSEVLLSAQGRLTGNGTKHIEIRVCDNGQGISDSQKARLFEPFERGSTTAEGTGLGLYICLEIVELMKGTLRCENGIGAGTCFVIDLVLEVAESGQPMLDASSENWLSGKRVLVAEDNPTLQVLTEKLLTKRGAQVVITGNGREALEAFQKDPFDLVLSDIFMPEMNGYEFVRAIRTLGAQQPIIGLTAATIGDETNNMLAAGATAVLSKPIDFQKLHAVLNSDPNCNLAAG